MSTRYIRDLANWLLFKTLFWYQALLKLVQIYINYNLNLSFWIECFLGSSVHPFFGGGDYCWKILSEMGRVTIEDLCYSTWQDGTFIARYHRQTISDRRRTRHCWKLWRNMVKDPIRKSFSITLLKRREKD